MYALCVKGLENDYPLGLTQDIKMGSWVLVNLRYSFNVHTWLPLCVALWIGIVKNPDAPSKRWKEDRWLVIT